MLPVMIGVKIDPPHPHACRKRRLNETGKTEVPCYSRCGTIKIPPCLKALSVEHRPQFCSPSPAIGDVSISVKNSLTGRKTLNNQSINQSKAHVHMVFPIVALSNRQGPWLEQF
jgi:hypothetical protein